MQTGHIADAIESYSKAIDIKPDLIRFRIDKILCGVQWENDEMIKAACIEMEEVLRSFPNSAEVKLAYAEMRRCMQECDLAVNYAEDALRLAPNNPSVLIMLGELYIEQGKCDDGLKLIGRVLENDSRHASAYKAVASYYSKKNDLSNVLDNYRKQQDAIRIKQEMFDCIVMQELNLAEIGLRLRFQTA